MVAAQDVPLNETVDVAMDMAKDAPEELPPQQARL